MPPDGRNLIELIKSDDTRVIVSRRVVGRHKSAGNSLCQVQVLRPVSSQPCARTHGHVYSRLRLQRRAHVCARCIGCRWRITRSGKANEEGLKPHTGGNATVTRRKRRARASARQRRTRRVEAGRRATGGLEGFHGKDKGRIRREKRECTRGERNEGAGGEKRQGKEREGRRMIAESRERGSNRGRSGLSSLLRGKRGGKRMKERKRLREKEGSDGVHELFRRYRLASQSWII